MGLGLLSAGLLSGCFASPPQIISLDPNRGSTSVAADAPVRVIFDRPVDRGSIATRFQVQPAIPGCDLQAAFSATSAAGCSVVWLSDRPGFELRHAGAIFAPNTKYTFILRGGFSDLDGNSNGLDHRWDVTSATAPQLRDVSPADGGNAGVDATPVVSFNSAMNGPETAAAISLSPPVAGTRVVQNTADRSRFVIYPGRLLDLGSQYTIRVSRRAVDDTGQPVPAPFETHFSTGGAIGSGLAAVLAAWPDESTSTVLVTARGPGQRGEPTPAWTALQAPRCVSSCGPVPPGQPLVRYDAAAVSADSRWLAVVRIDLTQPSPRPVLEVIDLVADSDRTVLPDADLPSWSRDGRLLAFASGGAVRIFDPQTELSSDLPAGAPLQAPAIWAGDDSTLVLPTLGSSGPQLELADRIGRARYPLPGAAAVGRPGRATLSPAGSSLAVAMETSDGTGTWLLPAGGTGSATQVAAGIVPVGFSDAGTLLGIDGQSRLVRINLAGGGITQIGSTAAADSAAVSLDGRSVIFVATDAGGVAQAFLEDADGSDAHPLTAFSPGTLSAVAVSFGG